MAGYNEILVGRYNRMLQKLLSMKGGAAMNTLSGELAATLSVFYGVENRYLESWGRFGVAIAQAAGGAGTRASFRIDNPKGSNIIAVIEKLIVTSFFGVNDAPILQYSIVSAGDQASTIVTTNTGLDNRGSSSPNLHVTAQATAQAVVGVTIHQINLAAGVSTELVLYENQELTLLPNSSYTMYSTVLNQGLNGVIWWRERVMEESELK
jgi:hypothetical protein